MFMPEFLVKVKLENMNNCPKKLPRFLGSSYQFIIPTHNQSASTPSANACTTIHQFNWIQFNLCQQAINVNIQPVYTQPPTKEVGVGTWTPPPYTYIQSNIQLWQREREAPTAAKMKNNKRKKTKKQKSFHSGGEGDSRHQFQRRRRSYYDSFGFAWYVHTINNIILQTALQQFS